MEITGRSGMIQVRPFRRTWLPDGHDGEIRYTNCADFLAVPINMRTGEMMTGLTDAEERELEDELLLPPKTLSRYNKAFWGDYKQLIRIDKKGLTLNLEKAWDYIKYKNLTVHPKCAINEAEKLNSPEYEYVITSIEAEAKFRNQIHKIKKSAYTRLDKLTMSDKKNLMKLYGHSIDDSYSEEIVDAKLYEYIENDPQTFLDKLDDPDFKMKVFIYDAIKVGALKKSGARYLINGGETIGLSLQETIDYLSNPANQDVYISLKAQVEVNEVPNKGTKKQKAE